eukprot:scaffold168817_cov40-Tisochrysis_lutea.AAC.1
MNNVLFTIYFLAWCMVYFLLPAAPMPYGGRTHSNEAPLGVCLGADVTTTNTNTRHLFSVDEGRGRLTLAASRCDYPQRRWVGGLVRARREGGPAP